MQQTSQKRITDPKALPEVLRGLEPTATAIWLLVQSIGTLKVSQRKLADALGTTQTSVSSSFTTLKEHGLIAGDFPKGMTPTYYATYPATEEAGTPTRANKTPTTKTVTKLKELPTAIKNGSSILKTLYFWGLTQNQITVSMEGLAELLGFERTAVSRSYKNLKDEGFLKEIVEASGNQPATFEINKKYQYKIK